MKNKFIALLIIASIALAQLGVFAFDDMAEERLSWAVEAVEAMAEKGIIKGYEDGTFRPDKEITKEEALILVSRICGFTDESSEKYKELATEIYGDFISGKYNTPYISEISFLMYRGVIRTSDLELYIAGDERTQPLKRYEAAMLITKLMGAEDGLEEAELAYDDEAAIPEESKPYVAYVTEEGLMNGMGENRFEPMTSLTRAQVATLLYRAMNKLDFTYLTGVLESYNTGNDIATIAVGETQEKYVITADVPVALDGNYAMFSDVPEGAEIRLTFKGEDIYFVDATTPEHRATVSLIFVEFEKLMDAVVVTFKEVDDSEEYSYSLADTAVITRNGAKTEIASLRENDLATVEIVGEKITRIDAESPQKSDEGTIVALHFASDFSIVISENGVATTYKVYDDVKVVRNAQMIELADLRIGDNVKIETKYNVIEKITATSRNRTATGTISEIVISAEPKITVNEDGTEKEYALLNSVEVKVNGEKADVYALRLGDTVTIGIEGETVTRITVTPAKEKINYAGRISYINTAYGYIKLDGVEERIVIGKAKFQNAEGKTITVKDVKQGDAATVFGTKGIGTVDAELIVVDK